MNSGELFCGVGDAEGVGVAFLGEPVPDERVRGCEPVVCLTVFHPGDCRISACQTREIKT